MSAVVIAANAARGSGSVMDLILSVAGIMHRMPGERHEAIPAPGRPVRVPSEESEAPGAEPGPWRAHAQRAGAPSLVGAPARAWRLGSRCPEADVLLGRRVDLLGREEHDGLDPRGA